MAAFRICRIFSSSTGRISYLRMLIRSKISFISVNPFRFFLYYIRDSLRIHIKMIES